MEWVVRRFLENLGPEIGVQRFAQLVDREKRLGMIFSPATTGRPEDCLDATDSFLNGLRRELGQDFLFDGWKTPPETSVD